jgi:hypothetical protein
MKTIEIHGNPISFGDVGKGPAVLLLGLWNEDHPDVLDTSYLRWPDFTEC